MRSKKIPLIVSIVLGAASFLLLLFASVFFFPSEYNESENQLTLQWPGWYTVIIFIVPGAIFLLCYSIIRLKAKSTSKRTLAPSEQSFYEQERQREALITTSGWDPLIPQAVDVIFETQQASVSILQRRLNLEYTKAAQLIDKLEVFGIIGPFDGIKPREILITREQWSRLEFPAKNEHSGIDIGLTGIIRNEENWRREQRGLSSVEDELYNIDHMEGHAFEHWCADLLRKNGFENVEVTQGSGDQGVDVLAEKDGITYAIQCKCYSNDLGNSPVQEVNTGKAVYNRHIGVVMTNRHFTKGAKDAAKATGVLLWDRDKISDLIKSAI